MEELFVFASWLLAGTVMLSVIIAIIAIKYYHNRVGSHRRFFHDVLIAVFSPSPLWGFGLWFFVQASRFK